MSSPKSETMRWSKNARRSSLVATVGSLPAELQSYVIFTAGVSASAKEPKAATALVDFLTTPGLVRHSRRGRHGGDVLPVGS